MSERDFRELLDTGAARGLTVCVGLDSQFQRVTSLVTPGAEDAQLRFNRDIVDATAHVAAAFKPNLAFYEARGGAGIEALVQTVRYIHASAPDVPVVLDAKRGDIGSTNEGYAQFLFELAGADAITVHPFLGAEAAKVFLDYTTKGIYVLCRTSNPGGGEFQDLVVQQPEGPTALFEVVATRVRDHWNMGHNCGLVVGATYPGELAKIRSLAPNLPLLIPGVGAQGGDLEATVAAADSVSGAPVLINSSRAIIFASEDQQFAAAARDAATAMDEAIRRLRR